MPGEKGVAAGRSLGLHDVPCRAARGGPAYAVELRDAEASWGATVSLELEARSPMEGLSAQTKSPFATKEQNRLL